MLQMQKIPYVSRRGYEQQSPVIAVIQELHKLVALPVAITSVMAEISGYAEAMGLNVDELEYRASMPEDDVVEVLQGKVTHVNRKYEDSNAKKFGFMADGTFFHVFQHCEFYCDGSDVPVLRPCGFTLPAVGDILIYERVDGRKGPRASWYATPASRNKALVAIAARPWYRLRRPGLNTILWKNKDLNHLRRLYPVDFKLDGYIVEKSHDAAERVWEECEDPR